MNTSSFLPIRPMNAAREFLLNLLPGVVVVGDLRHGYGLRTSWQRRRGVDAMEVGHFIGRIQRAWRRQGRGHVEGVRRLEFRARRTWRRLRAKRKRRRSRRRRPTRLGQRKRGRGQETHRLGSSSLVQAPAVHRRPFALRLHNSAFRTWAGLLQTRPRRRLLLFLLLLLLLLLFQVVRDEVMCDLVQLLISQVIRLEKRGQKGIPLCTPPRGQLVVVHELQRNQAVSVRSRRPLGGGSSSSSSSSSSRWRSLGPVADPPQAVVGRLGPRERLALAEEGEGLQVDGAVVVEQGQLSAARPRLHSRQLAGSRCNGERQTTSTTKPVQPEIRSSECIHHLVVQPEVRSP